MNTTLSFATPERLASMRKLGRHPAVVDVSAASEYHASHIEGATPVPLGELDPRMLRALLGSPGAGRQETLYLTCRDGSRARQAADRLLKAGYYNLAVLDGGNQAWEEAGLPMVRCEPAHTLDGQVQIAAGGIVMIPVVLGLAIHEFFFVGVPVIAAGLIVAGATRWSGMARLLSLMPWNRCGRPAGGLNAARASHADGLTTSAFLPFRGP